MKDSERHHQQVQSVVSALSGQDREALLAHARTCEECARGLAAVRDEVLPLLYLPAPHPVDPALSGEVRARLLARAGEARRRPGRGRAWTGASGWLVAAGTATLLLTHHSFHRPLHLGWAAAAVLGIGLFSAALYIAAQRQKIDALHRRLSTLERERGEARLASAT